MRTLRLSGFGDLFPLNFREIQNNALGQMTAAIPKRAIAVMAAMPAEVILNSWWGAGSPRLSYVRGLPAITL
jgi:hypothetical protein